jgi:hypothetical protein
MVPYCFSCNGRTPFIKTNSRFFFLVKKLIIYIGGRKNVIWDADYSNFWKGTARKATKEVPGSEGSR